MSAMKVDIENLLRWLKIEDPEIEQKFRELVVDI